MARNWGLFLLLAGAAGAGGWFAFLKRTPPVEVHVTRVERGTVERIAPSVSTGTVRADREADIRSDISGRIVRAAVREWGRVEEGTLIIELEKEKQQALLERAQAEVSRAQANIEKIKIDLQEKETFEARLRRVAAGERPDVSLQELDDAKARTEAARQEFRIAESELRRAQATLHDARADLARTQVTAPFTSIIAELFVEEGEVLNPGEPICRLVDASHKEIEAEIDEVDAGLLQIGQPARMKIYALPDRLFIGRLTKISPVLRSSKDQSRTVQVRVEVDDPEGLLKVGMSADLEVICREVTDVLHLPTHVIREGRAGEKYVYGIRKGEVVRLPVDTGVGSWDRTEITAGLSEGESVIMDLNPKIKPGIRVLYDHAGEPEQNVPDRKR
jgi:RND family efflux transporter MFP subunit